MDLLSLKDIGKIYVSEGNVSVGIRGVNLAFNRGEFVAVTGKSGSGKSTLLNVISGMDSYEEGELFVNGAPTSHYLQPEWEEYREKYISFIFQDYNIIDSFTVLQNVELALMHIEDKRERRARAVSLIDRVGLSSHLHQKGSRLSGGQKQRTVIARALAKDSPIILADEPTGNLDSASSREIVELLHEVSRDKLLIVVTHSFDQFEGYATRHIRIYDGAIESDHVITETKEVAQQTFAEETSPEAKRDKKAELKRQVKNGILLGNAIFFSKPRLSLFLCLLMIIGTLGLFFSTSLCGGISELFEPHYMFNNIDGRMVIAKQNGAVISRDELLALKQEHGAEGVLHYDLLLDEGKMDEIIFTSAISDEKEYFFADATYGADFGTDIIGRYPEKVNEVFLYLPIYYQPDVGASELLVDKIYMSGAEFDLVGVKYYFDNNLTPQCLFTEDGFRVATALHFLYRSSASITVTVADSSGEGGKDFYLYNIVPNFDMPSGKAYISSSKYQKFISEGTGYYTYVNYHSVYYNYDYYYGDSMTSYTFTRRFENADLMKSAPSQSLDSPYNYEGYLIVSDEILLDMAESVLEKSYCQASLFFESNEAAHRAVDAIKAKGYIAVPADTTYEPDPLTVIVSIILPVMTAGVWILSIIFLTFFITLCSSRALMAFKSDMAIMRSMGISVGVVRIGMYVRMLLALIPAYLFVAACAILVFTVPSFNRYFTYLYAWQYALIVIGMLALTLRATYKQIGKLFGESVKKSLKGGSAE